MVVVCAVKWPSSSSSPPGRGWTVTVRVAGVRKPPRIRRTSLSMRRSSAGCVASHRYRTTVRPRIGILVPRSAVCAGARCRESSDRWASSLFLPLHWTANLRHGPGRPAPTPGPNGWRRAARSLTTPEGRRADCGAEPGPRAGISGGSTRGHSGSRAAKAASRTEHPPSSAAHRQPVTG